MKKIVIYISLLFISLGIITNRISADETKMGDYNVTFVDETTKFTSDYDEDAIRQALQGMQPGDKAEISFVLKNSYEKPTNWYMSNNAIKPFEDDRRSSVSGGNYTYRLTYVDGFGTEKSLYDSEAVGGDDTQGLKDATNALDDMFLLDTINSGEETHLKMYFELDGETQANNYQDVIGQLRVNFAVEMDVPEKPEPVYKEIEKEDEKQNSTSGKTKVRKIIYMPYTGDEFNLGFYLITEAGLAVLLGLIIWRYRVYIRKQEGR